MEDFFKYLTAGDADRSWGLYMTVAGKSVVQAQSVYPAPEHPSGYYFSWQQGRVLQEYQLNYITQGSGIFETQAGQVQVKPGSLIVLRPGVWHRYKPNIRTGWTENYIGFDGSLAHQLLSNPVMPQRPLLPCGLNELFLDSYQKVFAIVQDERPGFQQIAAGMVVKLLGQIIGSEKQRNFEGQPIEEAIRKACFLMREQVDASIDLQQLAGSFHIGYSYFRKMFKKYTGVSPHQYFLQLKIMRAKEMLLASDSSIKAISSALGFESIYYFSRLFKNKVGCSPTQLRDGKNA